MIDTKWMFIFLSVLFISMFLSMTAITVSDNLTTAKCPGVEIKSHD